MIISQSQLDIKTAFIISLGGIVSRHRLGDSDRGHRAPPRHEDQGAGGAHRLLERDAQDGDVGVHQADDDESEQPRESCSKLRSACRQSLKRLIISEFVGGTSFHNISHKTPFRHSTRFPWARTGR